MLKFDFEFYNERRKSPGGGRRITSDHESLFNDQLKNKGFLLKKDIAKLKKEGIAFDELDFIVYSLFRHQNKYRKGYRNFDEISANAYNRICDFSSFYSFTDTVRNTLNQQQRGADRTYSEYQGVAGSLILTNTL